MVAHGRPMHLAKRVDPTSIPTATGIDSGSTVVNSAAGIPGTSLAFDPLGTSQPSISAPPLAPTNGADQPSSATPTTSSVPQTTSSESSTPTALAATSSIPLSTVVGSCIGAFIGATALILLGLWFYRRYSKSLKKRANPRGPIVLSRNVRGDEERRKSRLEPWNKLEDGDDDKWESMYQGTETKEVDQVAPMEKLTMFKKTPSVRTAYTHKSTNINGLHFPESYTEFDPKLAQTLSTGEASMPEPKPFLAQVEVGSDISWDTQTAGNASYLSVHSRSGGAMSPTLRMAIPTPPPTESQAHKWESAEVVQYSDAQEPETVNPFEHEPEPGEERKSVHNPFFNAKDYQPRSRSNSVTKSPKMKGKERMRYSETDPFDDIEDQMMSMPLPKPSFVQHSATASSSSTESKERALQSLIAALDIPENEVRDRLRIASMQPSIISQVTVSSVGYDDDVMKEFPLPPLRNGAASSNQHQP